MSTFNMQWKDGGPQGVKILKLSGPFTMAAVFDFQAAIRNDPQPALILDLSDVPYMDSASLGSLLGLHVSCQKDGRKYGLAAVPDRLKTLFRVAGVDGMMNVYPSVEEAEAAIG